MGIQVKKEVVCKLGMTGVVKKKVMVKEATFTKKLKKVNFPRIREPIPHLRFGEDVKIQAPLPQPVLRGRYSSTCANKYRGNQ